MKKKILVVILLVIVGCAYFGYEYYLSTKKENTDLETEKSVHNSEENVKETEKDEEKESYAQQTENESLEDTSYPQQKENSNITNESNAQETSKKEENKKTETKKEENVSSKKEETNKKEDTSKKEETKPTVDDEQKNQDELKWEQFKTDPVTLMILEADAPDWETKKEQQAEAKKWIDLGYRVEEPYVCIYLSDGRKCVYGLVVYMSKGVCNETPNEIKIDWRKRNYIGIVAYAKSLGYKCEGYQD